MNTHKRIFSGGTVWIASHGKLAPITVWNDQHTSFDIFATRQRKSRDGSESSVETNKSISGCNVQPRSQGLSSCVKTV